MVDILVIAYCVLFICQIQIFLMLSTFIATLFLLIYKLFSGYICELKFIFNFHCLLISSHLKMGSTTFHIFIFFWNIHFKKGSSMHLDNCKTCLDFYCSNMEKS